MVTLEQLRQFDAVARCGTLSAAAEVLHLSQPALSRSMQRFEREFPAALFERGANHVSVTEAGLLVAGHAREVLASVESMHEAVAELERRRRTIDIVSCAPAPLWRLLPQVERTFPGMTITSRIAGLAEVHAALAEDRAQLAVTTSTPQAGQPGFRCGSEQLYLSVPPAHPAAGLESVRLSELDGETMLLVSDLGFWADLVHERMPRATFLLQDFFALGEIARRSTLPIFTTDLARREDLTHNRVHVRIADPEANPIYWCLIHRAAYERLKALVATGTV